MTKTKKTKRTQIKDLSGSEKELTAAEAGQIKGGGKPSKEQAPTAIIAAPQTNAAGLSAHELAHTVQQGRG